MNTTSTFPVFDIEGAPFDRGRSYGRQCADLIRRTVTFYRTLYPQTPARLEDLGHRYLFSICSLAPELGLELQGISEGSGVAATDLALLNARSELLGGTECTSMAMPGHGLLGQTWDWCQPMEDLTVILRITRPDGTRILTMVEPGMLGKIGLNSDGVGVCINFLHSPVPPKPQGLPFHVVARLVLEARDFGEALDLAERHGAEAGGHLLIASAEGYGASVELAGSQRVISLSSDLLAHTNHYLGLRGNEGLLKRWDSSARLKRALKLARTRPELRSLTGLQQILEDRKGLLFPICGKYERTPDKGMVGTVAILSMDLRGGLMTIKKGHRPDTPFATLQV